MDSFTSTFEDFASHEVALIEYSTLGISVVTCILGRRYLQRQKPSHGPMLARVTLMKPEACPARKARGLSSCPCSKNLQHLGYVDETLINRDVKLVWWLLFLAPTMEDVSLAG